MRILVSRAGQQLGPFSLEQLREELAAGRISERDLAWWEGQGAWVQVSQVPGIRQATPPAMPAMPATSPQYPAYAGVPSSATDDSHGMSVASLILGLAALMGGCFTGIPAVICGHIARARQKRSGRTESAGMAITGLILGYALTAVSIIMTVAFFMFAVPAMRAATRTMQTVVQGTKTRANMVQIQLGLQMHALDNHGEFPETLEDLVPEYLPERGLLQDPMAPQFGESGYFYMRPDPDDPADTVVIASKGKDSSGRRALGLKDVTIVFKEWNPPPDL